MTCKVADAQGDTTDLVTGVHHEAESLYDSICRWVDWALVEVSRRLEMASEHEAQNLQQSGRDTVRGAAKKNQGSF